MSWRMSPVAPALAQHRSGYYYYASSPSSSATSATQGIGFLKAAPYVVDTPLTLARLGAEVTTVGDVGCKVRLGIYADSNGYPGPLLLDAGQIAGDVAAAQELTATTVLGVGVYWFAVAVQSVITTQPTLRVVSGWFPPAPVPIGTALPSTGQSAGVLSVGGVAGAFPGSFPAGATSASQIARLFFKAA